ncbi:MAG: HYR domain-containing protein, partial [Verrucomicrobia bacterium]|nr:HYR domain-containing protein [Verrucomicrobiota bacterium]
MTAKDAANNSGTASFTVTVADTTAPVVTPPADLTVEATSAAGALVTYPAATATDAVGVTDLTYSRESGTTFPLGTTIVTVTAKDAADNSG